MKFDFDIVAAAIVCRRDLFNYIESVLNVDLFSFAVIFQNTTANTINIIWCKLKLNNPEY